MTRRPRTPVNFPLVVAVDGGETRVFPGRFTIGKHGDLAVADPLMSPLHAFCAPFGPDWMIYDLGSTNGTLVNMQRAVGMHPLERGDRIRVGRTLLTVVPAG